MVPKVSAVQIDFERLKEVCWAAITDFSNLNLPEHNRLNNPLASGWGTVTQTKNGQYIYKDNGSKILGIAHLDSVVTKPYFDVVNRDENGSVCYAPQLDDRLGAYTIACLLPSLGIQCDVLLTEGEEHGASTGAFFEPPVDKQYNWMFQFDRTGADVVMYQYDSPANRELLRSVGLVPADGSFSDIAMMEHLGVCGFNVGCAYANYHSIWAYFDIGVYKTQVLKFTEFYKRYSETLLPWVATAQTNSRLYHGWGYTDEDDWQWDERNGWHKPVKKSYKRDNRNKDGQLWCDVCGKGIYGSRDLDCYSETGMCPKCYLETFHADWMRCEICKSDIMPNDDELHCYEVTGKCLDCYEVTHGWRWDDRGLHSHKINESTDSKSKTVPVKHENNLKYLSKCEGCKHWYSKKELLEAADDKSYCVNCIEEMVKSGTWDYCTGCYTVTPVADLMADVNDDRYCADCMKIIQSIAEEMKQKTVQGDVNDAVQTALIAIEEGPKAWCKGCGQSLLESSVSDSGYCPKCMEGM